MQLVFARAQQDQSLARGGDVGDLVEQDAVQVEGLVGADDQAAHFARHPLGLDVSQGLGDGFRPLASGQHFGLDQVFVDTRADGCEGEARGGQQGAPHGAGRRQNDLGHDRSSTWPPPAVMTLMIAAAVSSTERRVTSITGQP